MKTDELTRPTLITNYVRMHDLVMSPAFNAYPEGLKGEILDYRNQLRDELEDRKLTAVIIS